MNLNPVLNMQRYEAKLDRSVELMERIVVLLEEIKDIESSRETIEYLSLKGTKPQTCEPGNTHDCSD